MFGKDIRHLEDSTGNYTIGGYHPGYIGEILNDRYVLLKKLSMSPYASTWVAKDFLHSIYVTLRLYRSAPHYNEMGLEEVEKLQFMFKKSQEDGWFCRLIDYKENLGLSGRVSECENFCVKLTQQIPELVHPSWSPRQPLLHRLRVPRHVPRGAAGRTGPRTGFLNSCRSGSSKKSPSRSPWLSNFCTSTVGWSTPTSRLKTCSSSSPRN